jgi:hypothetical protein
MTPDEVRQIVKAELSKQLESLGLNIDQLPIEIRMDSLLRGDFEQNGGIFQLLGRIRYGWLFLKKIGGRVVAVILLLATLHGVYGLCEFIGDLIIPGKLPDTKRIASLVREGIIRGYGSLTSDERNEPETFVVYNSKWADQPEEHQQYLSSMRYSTVDNFLSKVRDPLDWSFVSSSGVSRDILTSSTNISISSASSSASPSPEDTEEA